MRKTITLLAGLLLAATLLSVHAQNTPPPPCIGDPLNLDVEKYYVENCGTPSVNDVDEFIIKGDFQMSSGMWKDAVMTYQTAALKAGWLTELFGSCTAPYYNSDENARQSVDSDFYKNITQYEKEACRLCNLRNKALVNIGIAYLNLEDPASALIYLHKALQLLKVNETDLWETAANGIARATRYRHRE